MDATLAALLILEITAHDDCTTTAQPTKKSQITEVAA